jgi:hypothetical protein
MSDRWTEVMLLGLEPHEHDFQEFKGAGWVVGPDGDVAGDFTFALSKQVSAFVNGAGGRLFLGIDDFGHIDGGVTTKLKGGGTRAWLEDVVPMAVDPPLRRCNVFEVTSDDPASRIRPGHAVYVVDLPASEDAPHQAKDHRYYLRIAGKSRPMGHLHVQDVLRRTRHPRLALSRLGPYGELEPYEGDPRGPQVLLQFRALIANAGRSMAHHVGLELQVPRPLAGSEVRRRMKESEDVLHTQTPGLMTFFRHHPTPLFPGQIVYAGSVWVSVHLNNRAAVRDGAVLGWTVYADDAEPLRGSAPLAQYQIVQRALAWLEEHTPDPSASKRPPPAAKRRQSRRRT